MITQAAIMDENGKVWSVPQPGRHGTVIQLRWNLHKLRTGCACVQGFVDEMGKFYTRIEASVHAIECKQQFWCYDPGDSSKRFRVEPPKKPVELFSEDLW